MQIILTLTLATKQQHVCVRRLLVEFIQKLISYMIYSKSWNNRIILSENNKTI